MMVEGKVRPPGWFPATVTILVAIDLAAWFLGRMISNSAWKQIAPPTFVIVTYVVVAVTAWCVARRAPRFPVLVAAMVLAGSMLTSRLIVIVLAHFLPGLIQRDHDAWVSGSIVEATTLALLCGSLAALVAGFAHFWLHRSPRRIPPVDRLPSNRMVSRGDAEDENRKEGTA